MNPHKPACFALIVHHGEEAPTQQAVASLLQGEVRPNTIIVIDHGDEPLRAMRDPVRIIRPSTNEGYMAGLTIGIGALLAEGVEAKDVVMCMNNDVVVGPSTTQALLEWFAARSQPAAVGASIGSVHLFTGRAHISQAKKTMRLKPSVSHQPYIHGSFFAAPYAVLARIPMPIEYFLYWEDVGFSNELMRQRVPLYGLHGLGVTHDDTEKSDSSQKTYYLVRGGAYFLSQKTSRPWRWYWLFLNEVRLLYHTLWSKKKAVVRGLRDARNIKSASV